MAIHKAGLIKTKVLGGIQKYITFSGTVKVEGTAVVRTILGYKKGFSDTTYTTESDSSGDWSLEMSGGSNDEFRIICVGETGENSQIYEHITE